MVSNHAYWWTGLPLAFFKLVMTVAIILSLISIIYTVGPQFETRFFPVVGKLTISNLHAGTVPGTAIFDAEFTKKRACEYLGIGWYRTNVDGLSERVAMVIEKTDTPNDKDGPTRPVGYIKTGPWTVSLPVNQIEPPFGRWAAGSKYVGSYAVLFHRCHPFWVTETEFYP